MAWSNKKKSGPQMKYNILIVFDYAPLGPMRVAIRDHLYSFKKNSKHQVFYLNLAYRETIPGYIQKMKFDLVIFHTIFFSARWDNVGYERTRRKAQFIKKLDAVKVGMPQDEHFKTDYICDLINEFDMDIIFSVSPESERPKFYSAKVKDSVKFYPVLTGYLDDRTVELIKRLAGLATEKTTDIGYRATRVHPSLGKHGILKPLIGTVFQEEGSILGLKLDISTRTEDTILGNDWFRFLLHCKYTIGVEGGASVIDRDGSIRIKTYEYLKSYPQASFEEIEKACFPDQDGYLQYYALSPRHLEACATRTCQILIEGEYNGILKPNVHYIQLKRDFSNMEEVLKIIQQDRLRESIVERAYQDIVESRRFSYESFVSNVINHSLQADDQSYVRKLDIWRSGLCLWNWFQERIHLHRIRSIRKYRSCKNKLIRLFRDWIDTKGGIQ